MSEEWARQTAVMNALPHALHPMHKDWRTKADALLDNLHASGWAVVKLPSTELGDGEGTDDMGGVAHDTESVAEEAGAPVEEAGAAGGGLEDGSGAPE